MRKRKNGCRIAGAAVLAASFAPTASAQVFDVVRQFIEVNSHAEPLGANRGVGLDGSLLCKHYQSIARRPATGTPYFYLTRSGNNTDTCATEGDDPGEILVVQMGSRDTDGERLRSNRLVSGSRFEDTAPPFGDRGIKSIVLNGTATDRNGATWPAWSHPGGTQIVDDVLVVPVEHRWSPSNPDDGGFLLVDVSTPNDPTLLKELDLDVKVGVMGVTRDPATGRYLFLLTGSGFGGGSTVRFVMSTTTNLRDPATALDSTTQYDWDSDTDPDAGDNDKWDGGGIDYQTINFVRDADGSLYVVGIDDTNSIAIGSGVLRLFRVTVNGGQYDLDYVAERGLGMTEPTTGDFDAGGGVYVTPSGQLLLYGAEHLSNGPGDSIRMGEWRYRDVNLPNDPACNGWITLYENTNGWGDTSSQSYTLDYQDRNSDDWDDLRNFEDHAGDLNGFSDEAESVRWNLPPGRIAFLHKDENYTGQAFLLDGTGSAMAIGDLSVQGFDNAITSLRFAERPVDMYVAPSPQPSPPCPPFGNGTPACPFSRSDSIQFAADRMGAPPCYSTQTIFLETGTYNQSVRIDRPMRLVSWQNGLVRIVGQ